jgi:hypothetical protein
MAVTVEIEIKNMLYVNMTSGIVGPEIELTDEQVQELVNRVSQLNKLWVGSAHFEMLGPDHYLVYAPFAIPNGVRTNAHGFVSVWKDDDWINYQDTAGVWGYLAPFASQAIIQWREGQEHYSKEYAEKAAAGVPGYFVFPKADDEKMP